MTCALLFIHHPRHRIQLLREGAALPGESRSRCTYASLIQTAAGRDYG